MTKVPDQLWDMMKQHLGYTDEEIALFKNNPRNVKVMAAVPSMQKKTIVFEVVESQGCNSQHKVGTRFFFTGDGNLITKMAPSRICAYAMPIMAQAIFGVQELWYAGIDPNTLCFKRAGCFDVGIRCGGWGISFSK
ncbi:MAG: hypothetical protein HUU50_05780 [Candidatus Brocadiae bacterium]|nr:hypothetical protein [Candidatus Brocadiia bacterium]